MNIASAFGPDQFRKANRSKEGGDDCVEVARGRGWAVVRDDKQEFGSPADYQLRFPVAAFDDFQAKVRAAALRTAVIPAGVLEGCCIAIVRREENVNVLYSTIEQPGLPKNVELVFDDGEIVAFFDGVLKREFDLDSEGTASVAA